MKFIYRYIRPIQNRIFTVWFLKMVAAFFELMIPFVLEHILDVVVQTNSIAQVFLWGGIMIVLAILARQTNIFANRSAVQNATDCIENIRKDLFDKTINLSGEVFDEFGLPSLTSRLTSDSYNVQGFVRMIQTLGVRAPILLIGGITLTLIMDAHLASILCCIAPIMIILVVFISRKGIPLYERVQQRMDEIVRVMRENITGVRVVKALSKEEYEKSRFFETNENMTRSDMKASIVMALPGPVMQLCLNAGLTLVVYIGAIRVNDGLTEPGVILAFLTYFNMVLMGVMGLNRTFMMMSKANASAYRIAAAIDARDSLTVEPEENVPGCPDKDSFVVFDHVTFAYHKSDDSDKSLEGEERQNALTDIDFRIRKGGSLGIIGPTGCGKSTIFNLLTRFYDVDKGGVYVNGKNVKCYDKDALHSMFGTVFQNDVLLTGSIRDNIDFGRSIPEERLEAAIKAAGAYEFISKYENGLDFEVTKLGTNLSGGQKQRVLISRALAGDPQILILDDASSALDYRTDANVRKGIKEICPEVTLLIVAQRISSIMNCDEILVMDDGRIIGRGTHAELLDTCETYKEIYDTQMGE